MEGLSREAAGDDTKGAGEVDERPPRARVDSRRGERGGVSPEAKRGEQSRRFFCRGCAPGLPQRPRVMLVEKVDQLLADSWQIVEEKQKHVEAIKDEMIKETMLCTEFARRQHDKSRKQSKGEASAERFKWSFACDMYCAEHLSFSVKSVRAGRESKGGEGWEDKC